MNLFFYKKLLWNADVLNVKMKKGTNSVLHPSFLQEIIFKSPIPYSLVKVFKYFYGSLNLDFYVKLSRKYEDNIANFPMDRINSDFWLLFNNQLIATALFDNHRKLRFVDAVDAFIKDPFETTILDDASDNKPNIILQFFFHTERTTENYIMLKKKKKLVKRKF